MAFGWHRWHGHGCMMAWRHFSASDHLQPLWWRRLVSAYQECFNVMVKDWLLVTGFHHNGPTVTFFRSRWHVCHLAVEPLLWLNALRNRLFGYATVTQHCFTWYFWVNHCNNTTSLCQWCHIDGLMQERRNSIANALELHLSCTNPSIYSSNEIRIVCDGEGFHLKTKLIFTVSGWNKLKTVMNTESRMG